MRRTKWLRIIAIVFAFVLIAASCGDDDAADGGGVLGTEDGDDGGDSDAPEPAPAPAEDDGGDGDAPAPAPAPAEDARRWRRRHRWPVGWPTTPSTALGAEAFEAQS